MREGPRDEDYLEHIQQAISRINRYAAGKNQTDFRQDEMMQDAVIRNLEIVGEAVSRLSDELKTKHENIPWRAISGMRNRLVHGYMTVNLDIVWSTVEKVLPEFEGQVKELLHEVRSG